MLSDLFLIFVSKLISGGDGTVGWMLSCLDDIVQEMKCKLPAVLPLSTGKGIVTNDSCAPRFWSKFISESKLTWHCERFVLRRYVIDFKSCSTNLIYRMEI